MGSTDTYTGGYSIEEHPLNEPRRLRIVVVGAGAAGLNFAYACQKYLRNIDLVIYEKNSAIGGTWLENRYPGVRCDIPSHNYQFSWNPNPEWSEFYVTGQEILDYFQNTAKKHHLDKYVELLSRVASAVWNEEVGKWTVTIEDVTTGQVIEDHAHFLINGSGFLNNWKWPDIPGLSSFEGTLVHSANWNSDIDLTGKAVALIGNGSTGIQLLPEIQKVAKLTTTFIRSPTWITTSFAQVHAGPNGTNFKYTDQQKREFKEDAEKYRQYCKELEAEICSSFPIVLKDSEMQQQARLYLADMMKKRLGPENPLINHLIPNFGVLCRRGTPGIGYLEAMSEPNVRVVLEHIDKVTPEGITLKSGETVNVDIIVCATGFDLSWKPRFPIIGRNNTSLHDQFKERPTGYLGIAIQNMPNYFVYFGPNSPLAHGSTLPAFELITQYMIRMIHKVQTQGYHSFEPSARAVHDFIEHADAFFPRTIWSANCRSWFKGGKEEGPVYALHPGSRSHWVHVMNEPRYEDYFWKSLNRNKFAYLGNGFSLREVEGGDLTWYMDQPEEGYNRIRY